MFYKVGKNQVKPWISRGSLKPRNSREIVDLLDFGASRGLGTVRLKLDFYDLGYTCFYLVFITLFSLFSF